MSDIQEFYNERSVFLTGASGFLGKQILEKLLRSCNVKNVYVLLRPKKDKTSEDRRDDLINSKIFTRVKMNNPGFASRIVVVPGDMTSPGMGLSEEDMEVLRKNVTVVIHSAASINFTEKIRDAVTVNVIGLLEMIKFAKTMPYLESFVHVSTAYVNCHQESSSECVVRPYHDLSWILELIQTKSDEVLEAMTPKLIHPWPNTYTFTKSLAEWLFLQEMSDIPSCIFRPSVITASADEPLRGWVDNFNAATGMMAVIASGILRSWSGHLKNVADLVPVDLCANAIITLGWSTAMEKSVKPPVYNFTSGQLNPLVWEDVVHWTQHYFNTCPLKMSAGRTHLIPSNSRIAHKMRICEDRIKFYLLDLLLHLQGQRPKMVQLHKMALKGAGVLEYFTDNEWDFEMKNIPSLIDKLSSEDRVKFNTDIRTINWHSYLVIYCQGIKDFVMKESFEREDIIKARKMQSRMEMIAIGLRLSFLTFMLALVWRAVGYHNLRMVTMYIITVMKKIFTKNALPAP